MSAKVHLHLHVSDLTKSREFYERFLGGSPVKVKEGYVKFLPQWAPVNLALSTGGLPVVEEMGVDCCHANQDKFWVKDPDGVEWEVYHLNYDLEGSEPQRLP